MTISNDKFQELEQNNDIGSIISLLKDDRWQYRQKAILLLIRIGDHSAIAEVRKLLGDENKIVRETAANYLKLNDAFPKSNPEDIVLYPFATKDYTLIKRISARSDKLIGSEDATIADVNMKLREEAADLGANAIIELVHDKGILTLFRGVEGHGNAVFIKDLNNVERKQNSGLGLFAIGIFCIMLGLIGFIPLGMIGIFYFVIGLFSRLGCKNKTYFLILSVCIIGFVALEIFYILKNDFQYFTMVPVLLTYWVIDIFLHEYIRRKNDPEVWKDQWGFN